MLGAEFTSWNAGSCPHGHVLAVHKSYLWHGLGRADFGSKPSLRRRAELEKLHPAGLTDDWADKLAGKEFYSHNLKATFEHYLQVPSRRLQISSALSCAAEQAHNAREIGEHAERMLGMHPVSLRRLLCMSASNHCFRLS